MFIEHFNTLLKIYYRHRFSKKPNENRKRGKSYGLLKKAFEAFKDEFNKTADSNRLSIDLSDGTGNLATKPFIRIYDPHASPSGKKGFYIAISFFTEPEDKRLMISITKGREDSEHKPEEERAIIEKELRKASQQFASTHIRKRDLPADIKLISDNTNENSVAVAFKTISAKSLVASRDDELMKVISYLCGIYRKYVDHCYVSEDLPVPPIKNQKGLANIRQGHNKFRKEVSARYNNTCVITGCKLLDVCDAAHIVPYSEWTGYDPNNGLLMRADMHRLFDKNKIIIEANGNIMIVDEDIQRHYSGKFNKRIDHLSDKTKDFLHRRKILIS